MYLITKYCLQTKECKPKYYNKHKFNRKLEHKISYSKSQNDGFDLYSIYAYALHHNDTRYIKYIHRNNLMIKYLPVIREYVREAGLTAKYKILKYLNKYNYSLFDPYDRIQNTHYIRLSYNLKCLKYVCSNLSQ